MPLLMNQNVRLNLKLIYICKKIEINLTNLFCKQCHKR
jgi:hypothetical protein